MVNPLYLTLLVGPMEPLPAPKPLVDALTSVEVTESATGRSGFQLVFTLADYGILETFFLLAGGAPMPIIRVVLLVTFPGLPQVLVDGVVLHTEVQPDAMSGSSKLIVTGQDLTALMDLIDFSGLPYPGMPSDVRALVILAKYAMFGVVPEVIPVPAPDIPIPLLQTPSQKKTDFQYLQHLAHEVGYVFYMVPGPFPGQSQAYWGPQVRAGLPQTALNVNMDTWTNVESLSFRYEPQNAVLPIIFIQDPISKVPIPIPIPPVTPFSPPLGAAIMPPQKIEFESGTAKLNPAIALMKGFARVTETCDTVTGEGTIDVMRYGSPLRARSLVGVRGAGLAFDGMHFVDSATHRIKAGEYKQSFVLKRNALVPTTPVVPSLPF
ncbi:MAG TPA: hypothetical protein VG267_10275 [Terracidiphilus sp.]|jgi:hypothetical protein|nr:hypothetical protein [Terracidiphilus sp.]